MPQSKTRCPTDGQIPLLYIPLMVRMPELDLWKDQGMPWHI